MKSFDAEQGIIRGIATTPKTDRDGDVVVPEGAVFELPIPLLFNHSPDQPIGHVIEATVTKSGIEIVAQVAKDATAKIAEIWQMIKAGLVKGFSVGFRALEAEPIETGFKFNKWQWLELSAVTIPANTQAAIQVVKSITTEVHPSMTIAEQIKAFEQKKADAIAKMDGLVIKGATLQGDDETAYEAAKAEVADIEKHLARLHEVEQRQAKAAKPVQGSFITVESNLPKGTDFVRYTKALAIAQGNPFHALEVAKAANFGARVQNTLKAAVAAGYTGDANYAPLVDQASMVSEFVELLQPATIVGRLPSLRRVPMNIRFPKQSGATSASWVGEAKPAPLTGAAFSDATVSRHKVSAIVALSNELIRLSDPNAENLIRADLIGAAAKAVDLAFCDVANAGVAGVKPASVFNGTANTAAASGTNAAAVRVDVAKIFGFALAANQPLDGACWLMHPAIALQLSMMRHATSGQPEFPGIAMDGGTFFGLPVITSNNVPGNSTVGYPMSLIVQPEILLAEEGVSVEAGREVSLEMDSAPTNDGKTPTAASLVSMWQNDLTAIKVIRPITWQNRRPSAVAQITATKYAA